MPSRVACAGVGGANARARCGRLGNNLAGHYKRGVGMAFQIGIGNFGGAIASNIYRTQDAPRYILGRTSPLTFPSASLSNECG